MTLVSGGDGSPKIVLTEPSGSSAEVCCPASVAIKVLLQGGKVISWKNAKREELLFKSSKKDLKPQKSCKGGLCICFPEFSTYGSLEQHGFANNRLWALDRDPSPLPPPKNNSTLDILLKSTDDDLKTWPCRFELRLHIMLSPGKLTLIPRVRNTGSKAFSFTFALQNYLSVSDISEVRVEGLETLDYFDNLMRRERFTEQADAITFDGEVDRVYLCTPRKIAIIDHDKKRTLVLRKEYLPDAVLWNPWDKRAKTMPDFGVQDYKSMLCVDSAAVEKPIVLNPFQEWRSSQELSAVSSSYCSGQLEPWKVLSGK